MRGNRHNEGFFSTEKEHKAIEEAAIMHGVTKSTLIRLILFGKLPQLTIKEGKSE